MPGTEPIPCDRYRQGLSSMCLASGNQRVLLPFPGTGPLPLPKQNYAQPCCNTLSARVSTLAQLTRDANDVYTCILRVIYARFPPEKKLRTRRSGLFS